ncbi:MAG: hypothetical protein ACI93N_000015 [Flavobacteriaceae bacterium]
MIINLKKIKMTQIIITLLLSLNIISAEESTTLNSEEIYEIAENNSQQYLEIWDIIDER